VSKASDNQLVELQKTADDYSLAALEKLPQLHRAVSLSRGIKKLRSLLSGDVLKDLCELKDTNLGFRTDGAPYPPEVVRDCLIEAMLRGARPSGNEFNIIAGRCYLTKEYYTRMVGDLVSNLKIVLGVPEATAHSTALISGRAQWHYHGERMNINCMKNGELDERIEVRVNKGMGVDAMLGKAERKLLARIYRRVTGSTWMREEDESDPQFKLEAENAVRTSTANDRAGNRQGDRTAQGDARSTANPS